MELAVNLAAALQVYSQKELQSTATSTSNVAQLLEKSGIRKGSFDNLFPAMFSLHGLDINESLNTAIRSKDLTENAAGTAVEGITRAMLELSSKYPILTSTTFIEIEALLQEFADSIVNVNTITSTDILKLKGIMSTLKTKFASPYIVAYSAGTENSLPSIKLLHNSFSNLRNIVNNVIKKHVLVVIRERKITNSKLLDSTYLTTKIINWGHTRTGDSIISGKLIASLMSLRGSGATTTNNAFSIISKDFIKETGQEHTEIKLHKGDLTSGSNEVLSLVIKSSVIQKVIVQNRRYNQEDLGQLEKKWSLIDSLKRGGTPLLDALGVKSIDDLVTKLLNTRASPTTVEDLGYLIASAISGIKPKKTGKVVPLLKKTTPIKKTFKSIDVKSNLDKSLKLAPIRTTQGQFYSLANLQMLINTHLQDVISANMGNGGENRILNYRTGRFAASANVERMSQSREGMVTAFYTYQKNPYATFSEGGRQSTPVSRDPKLLIGKSIKEIAATKVGNRLRAVLI